MAAVFPNLSTAELETLLAALDQHLGDPGSMNDGLGDPRALLARVDLFYGADSLVQWLEDWCAAKGSQRPCA